MAQRIRTHQEHQEEIWRARCKRGIHWYAPDKDWVMRCRDCKVIASVDAAGNIVLDGRSSYLWAHPQEEKDD